MTHNTASSSSQQAHQPLTNNDFIATIDPAQVGRMLQLLYEPGDYFALFTYPDDKGSGAKSTRWFQATDSVLEHLQQALLEQNARQPRGAALTVCAFNGNESREAKNAVAISVLAVDIDRDNLNSLFPGVERPEDAIAQVLALLKKRGLQPHAVVVSGHGLHLYFAIERVRLVDDEVRRSVKAAWKRLGVVLGGATDRHDLASVMRCWGTTNWKDGSPGIPVRLVVEHSDLEAPRYLLSDIEDAVKGVTCEKPKRAKKPTVPLWLPSINDVDPWETHIIEAMEAIDENFALARRRSRGELKVKDRSEADWSYSRLLLECGCSMNMVAAEMRLSAKGQERSESYVNSTVQAAVNKGPQAIRIGEDDRFQTFDNVSEAAYKILRNNSPSCGDTSPPSSHVISGAVISRPGSQKTRGTMNVFAGTFRLEFGRVGIMTAFTGEALRIEHAVNTLYPFGLEATINGVDREFEQDLPRENVRYWDDGTVVGGLLGRLPADVLEYRRNGRRIWTSDALAGRKVDPAAVFINSRHPRDFDQRLEWNEDGEGNPVPPGWASSEDDDALYQPHAVAKFRATAKYCLSGLSQKDLDRPGACRGCNFNACRSNPEPGSARSYWRKARVAVLTHGAYRAHHLFQLHLNEFDGLVCDELPDFVYRTPRLQIKARPTASGRASWEVEPVDTLLRVLTQSNIAPTAEVEFTTQELQRRRERLTKLASKLRSEVTDRTRSGFEFKVDEFEPLLTKDEFQTIGKFVSRAVYADLNIEEMPDEVAAALTTLSDFCGEKLFPVLAQQEFRSDGSGSLVMVRPVNGWPEILNGPDGAKRPLAMLDATASLDPRYLLAGGFVEERLPAAEFPNTTLVITSAKTVTKTELYRQTPEQVVTDLATRLRDHRIGRGAQVLVVTDKESEPGIRGALATFQRSHPDLLPETVHVDHFGNLRGKNQYIDCDAVYFTHLFRRPDDSYLGIELLLAEFDGFPKQWTSKNAKEWHIRGRAPEVLHAWMVCDLYQDLMRINIRGDPSAKATVFLPTTDSRLLTRIMRLMRGTTLVLANGSTVAAAHSNTAAA